MSNETLELSLAPVAVVTSTLADRESPMSGGRSARSGPGWFDSSFDLHRGLEVREGWPGDARLRSWIESFLGASSPGPAGESLSAT